VAVELKTNSRWLPAARSDGDAVVARLAGEIDLNNSPELRGELFNLLGRQPPRRLILNLSDVPYMDSSAIAVLVEVLQKMRKTGGKVWLTNLQPRVQGLIEIARLGTIFAVATDESEALSTPSP
jgi:anti-sigma B factor antagonist